jgi:uncharacterized protein YhaN
MKFLTGRCFNFAILAPLMKTFLPIPALMVLLCLANCSTKESARLARENDSLKMQLQFGHEAIVTLKEINSLIDSIDATRKILRIQMIEGMPLPKYTQRMEELLLYVQQSEEKISGLALKLRKIQNQNEAYSMMLDALKNELEMATHEIAMLEAQVKRVEKKNNQLINLVKLQQTEIEDHQEKLEAYRHEVSYFEKRIHELMIQSQVGDAEAYYARAEAVYEAARRTKLAPRKKRESLNEALELYKKASSLGKKEADARIKELEKRLE